MQISPEKQARLARVSTTGGVISALAMDQRKSLRKMIAKAEGVAYESVPDARLIEFKSAVTAVLTKQASAVLLDPEYGIEAMTLRAAGCGLLTTYEADGFENPRPHRMPALMPLYSVARLRELGSAGIKILLHYDPDGDPVGNEEKRAMMERIGAECAALDMPFFLEPVVYDSTGDGMVAHLRKPDSVMRTMAEFSKPVYQVDMLKVEFPVNAEFLQARSVAEAKDWYRRVDSVAQCPYIYLSAGISSQQFLASLRLAAESGARFSGVLCGRATWQDGIADYVRGGVPAFEEWLGRSGLQMMRDIADCLAGATPYHVWLSR